MHTIFHIPGVFRRACAEDRPAPPFANETDVVRPVFHHLKPACHSQLAADAGCCSLLQCVASSEKQCERVNPSDSLRGGYIQKMKDLLDICRILAGNPDSLFAQQEIASNWLSFTWNGRVETWTLSPPGKMNSIQAGS